MIHREVIKSLSEDEWAILFYLTNVIYPIGCGEVNKNTIQSYKIDHLRAQIASVQSAIKPEYLPVYFGLANKFEVPITTS